MIIIVAVESLSSVSPPPRIGQESMAMLLRALAAELMRRWRFLEKFLGRSREMGATFWDAFFDIIILQSYNNTQCLIIDAIALL